MVKTLFLQIFLASCAGAQSISYFNQGFLRQPSAEADRTYLGLSTNLNATNLFGIINNTNLPNPITNTFVGDGSELTNIAANFLWKTNAADRGMSNAVTPVRIGTNLNNASPKNALLEVDNGYIDMGKGTNNLRIVIGNGAYITGITNDVNVLSDDVFIGYYAAANLPDTNQTLSTVIGAYAMFNTINAFGATVIGQKSCNLSTNVSSSTTVGAKCFSAVPYAANDTAIGYGCGQFITNTATGNRTLIGTAAGQFASGDFNVFIGGGAGYQGPGANSTSGANVGIGNNVLSRDVGTGQNVGIGVNALQNLQSFYAGETAVGYEALQAGTSFNGTAIGQQAGQNATGPGIYLGGYAGQNNSVFFRGIIGGDNQNTYINSLFIGSDAFSTLAHSRGPMLLESSQGSGANNQGMDFIVAGGAGTGTAPGGNLGFDVALPAGSGSASNSLFNSIFINGTNGYVYVNTNSYETFVTSTNGFASYRSNTIAPTTIVVGPSPFSFTNPVNCNINVFVDANGGNTTVGLNGTTIFVSAANGDHTVPLQTNEWTTVTYTGTPNMSWHPL